MGRLGWVDASMGASGDMLLGALVGAGVPEKVIAEAVAALGLPVTVSFETTTRAGLVATRAVVRAEAGEPLRHLSDVLSVIGAAALDSAVAARATAVFSTLAEAEAAVHGVGRDEVHFHEVGALDALADVVGVCAGFHHLGLDALHCSTVSLGGGTASTEHGTLGVPVPAVLELLTGKPVVGGPVDVELCTPTGAALLVIHVDAWGPLPAMTAECSGSGAGGRDLEGRANLLRLVVGTASAVTDLPLVLEANVDDLDPRLWPGVLESLIAAGASDAWLTPILMKKGRPAHVVSALVPSSYADAVTRALVRGTSTLGVRTRRVDGKLELDRRWLTVDVDGQPVRIKVGSLDGEVVNAQPEWDDVAAAAAALGRPAKQVLAQAIAAAHPPPTP